MQESAQDIQAILERIVNTLTLEYRPDRIVLFGSYVQGQPTPASDIDLLIIKDSQLSPYQRLVQVRRLLRDPYRRIPIDLLVITPSELEERLKRGDQFLRTIVSQGKVLYAA